MNAGNICYINFYQIQPFWHLQYCNALLITGSDFGRGLLAGWLGLESSVVAAYHLQHPVVTDPDLLGWPFPRRGGHNARTQKSFHHGWYIILSASSHPTGLTPRRFIPDIQTVMMRSWTVYNFPEIVMVLLKRSWFFAEIWKHFTLSWHSYCFGDI